MADTNSTPTNPTNNDTTAGERRSFSPRNDRMQRPAEAGGFNRRPPQGGGSSQGGQRFGSRPPFGRAPGGSAGRDGNRFGGAGGRFAKKRTDQDQDNILSKVVMVRRVTRVVKGGKRMRFSALVVVGDKMGKFGVGLKKGNDYADSVNKATNQAKKNMKSFELDENGSIPYTTTVKFKAAQIFLKPAKSGTGLIAGGPIRSILELAGIKNIYSKIIGSNNKITNIIAIQKALTEFGVRQSAKPKTATPKVEVEVA